MSQGFQKLLNTLKDLYRKRKYEGLVSLANKRLNRGGGKAVELSDIYLLCGRSYWHMGDIHQAISCIKHSIQVDPKNHQAYAKLGSFYLQLNNINEAIKYYEMAIQLNPSRGGNYLSIASAYCRINQPKLAIPYYLKLIELEPSNAMAYRNLSTCLKYENIEDSCVDEMLCILAAPDLDDESRLQGNFCLGKIYDDCGVYDKAFVFYQMANAIKSKAQKFNVKKYKSKINQIIAAFDEKKFQNFTSSSSLNFTPIFVLGLSRSGKSIVESVIQSYPKAVPLGEMAVINDLVDFLKEKRGISTPEALSQLTPDTIAVCIDFFMTKLKDYSSYASEKHLYTIDTTPSNFRQVGLIALLFPQAKFIHCIRNPLDHCLQIYFQYYARGNNYSFDLATVGYFYLEHVRMMNHWKQVFPEGSILEVPYENLILNPDSMIMKIQKFIRIEEKPEDLEPLLFLKELLYASEVGRWVHYEKYLDILVKIFERESVGLKALPALEVQGMQRKSKS